MKENHMKQRF